MERITLRKPHPSDFMEAASALLTLRGLPPLILSLALLMVLTSGLLLSVCVALLCSYVHQLWACLVDPP